MHASLVEWWNGISLRAKITATIVLIMTVGLVVSGYGTMTVLRDFLVQDLDTQVTRALDSVREVPSAGDVPQEYAIATLDSTGAATQQNGVWQSRPPALSDADRRFVADNPGVPFSAKDPAGTALYRMAGEARGAETLLVGLPLEPTNREIARLFTLLFLFGIGVVILGAFATWLLISSVFAPLRQVERTAAAIAEGDFGQRLAGATPNTEVGRLNRSLNQMLNRIDRALADRARTIEQMRRFVGDASHELRTPLVSVRGYAELYRMGALQSREDVAQAMDRIEREAVRLGALVTDLLALARLDEARPLNPKPVELLPLAHDAALDARALAPKRLIRVIGHDPEQPTGAIEVLPPVDEALAEQTEDPTTTASRLFRRRSLATDALSTGAMRLRGLRKRRERDAAADEAALELAPGDALPLVMGEEDKLRQVLTNLIGNAMRYTPDDTPIEIAAYADARRNLAFLEVIDHGEGIPPQIRDKIFQRFWRADSSRTRDTGGSGLGLAIVAAIVQAHDGAIGISETPGGGATFRISLPLLTNDRPDEDVHSDEEIAPPVPAAH